MNETKKKDATAKIFILCTILLFIVSAVFTGLNISFMRECDLNYYKTTAVVTRLTTNHGYNNHNSYLKCTITYTYTTADGVEREVQGIGQANGIMPIDPDKIYVGKTIEIYVDSAKNEAIPVDGADLYSVISVVIFAFFAVTYVAGSAIFLHEKGRGLKYRLLITWLPIAVICVVSVLLFWAGLPYGGFAEIFKRVGGANGYTVMCAISCIAGAADAIISKKMCDKV